METGADCHVNYGYGGNFVQNGLIETADRGANQDNCVASEIDGSNDYLSRPLVVTGSKVLTISGIFKPSDYKYATCGVDAASNLCVGLYFKDTELRVLLWDGGVVKVEARVYATDINMTSLIDGYTLAVSASVDTAISTVNITVNGISYTPTLLTMVQDSIFETTATMIVGKDNATGEYVGELGELYFDTNYIDLATNNPFWNSDTNKPIPVRTAMANLGSNPLICMPIDASSPTTNYGSGGNFVLNGGGLIGSRGASEYIGRTIVSDASNKVEGNIFCKSLVKWIDNVPSYLNDVTLTASDVGTVGYYFGFSDTIDWNLEANKNLVTNQLGYMREPSQVISDSGWTPVLGLFFEDTANFGANSYGTDYTVTGSPTSGADITI